MKTENVIIALCDPKLDHIPEGTPSDKSQLEDWHPITSLLTQHKTLPIVTRFYLISEKEHPKPTERLKSIIPELLVQHIRKRIPDEEHRIAYQKAVKVESLEIDYKDIWDTQSCIAQFEQVLSMIDLSGTRIIVSLSGGTAAAKSALYIATQRALHKWRNSSIMVVRDGGNQAKAEFIDLANAQHSPIGILADAVGTRNPDFRRQLDRTEAVITKSSDEKLLIHGPTGSGKSRLARIIIEYLQSIDTNVTKTNCITQNVAALSPNMIESELFGHEKGAFTGADKQHRGIFERANKGVVFLDEIGELPKHLQAKLLTVLDGTPFYRIGGTEPVSSSFMLICGTNRNLQEEVKKSGDFRRDLLERISTWQIEIPCLGNRPQDILSGLQQERGRWKDRFRTELRFQPRAQKLFIKKATDYKWPGNFREFHSTIWHLAMFAEKEGISCDSVKREFADKLFSTEPHASHVHQTDPAESADEPDFDRIDLARLSFAISECRKCKTANEAGRLLYDATCRTSKASGHTFNGSAYLQRIFREFGLKAVFKHGVFNIKTANKASTP